LARLLEPFAFLLVQDGCRDGHLARHPAPRPPAGRLVWIHAVSVGEAVVARTVIDILRADGRRFLLTVTTPAAQALMARDPAPDVTIGPSPLDLPGTVARFLDHWRPDLLVLIESEIWPLMLLELERRGIPAAIVNARLSARSARRWRWLGSYGRRIFATLDCVLARDGQMAGRYAALGAARVAVAGDIKAAACPLPVEGDWLAELRASPNARFLWLAASTHEGEEEIVAAAQRLLRQCHGGARLALAPRHPERADHLDAMLRRTGLVVERLSLARVPTASADIWLIDRIGVLGTLFEHVHAAFIGGSLVPLGGHNPFEAIRHGALPVMGPFVEKLGDEAARLQASGALAIIADAGELADHVARVFQTGHAGGAVECERRALAAMRAGKHALVARELEPLLSGDGELDPLFPDDGEQETGR
ncbi:MAG: hypothetical protein KDH19_13995, partial [Geminicoccaceae bacterium]|nr:hypothetical protein [Geminicoccaceae bacterium]